MALLFNIDINKVITRFVSFDDKQEVNRAVLRALDGKEYISIYGKPTTHYELTIYVDEEGKKLLLHAEQNVELLRVSVRKGDYTGRIIELSKFEKLISGWYKAIAILTPDSEV